MCSLQCFCVSLSLHDNHTCMCMCGKDKLPVRMWGPAEGQWHMAISHNFLLKSSVSEFVCVGTFPCALMCNCPRPDCSDHWASILHFRGVNSPTAGNFSPTSKRFKSHIVAKLLFIIAAHPQINMSQNNISVSPGAQSEGLNDRYGLHIIRPPSKEKNASVFICTMAHLSHKITD